MFTPKELTLINLEYFNLIFCASDICELESHNGDHWMIVKVQTFVPKYKVATKKHFNYYYQLYHRHNDADGFHLQAEHIDLLDAVLDIINHDDYRLRRRGSRHFDEVVEEFG